MQTTKEQQILSNVIEKAWEDESFKANLIASSDPMAFIEEFAGEKLNLPNKTAIKIADQSDPAVCYLNLPPEPDMENLELNDEQLEMVAGGDICLSAVLSAVFSAACLSYTISAGYNGK